MNLDKDFEMSSSMLTGLWSSLLLSTFVYMCMYTTTPTPTCTHQVRLGPRHRNISSVRGVPSLQVHWSPQSADSGVLTAWPSHQVLFTKIRHLTLDGFSSFTCMCNVLWTARVLDWQKPFPHTWHLKGFSFEWMYLRKKHKTNVLKYLGLSTVLRCYSLLTIIHNTHHLCGYFVCTLWENMFWNEYFSQVWTLAGYSSSSSS